MTKKKTKDLIQKKAKTAWYNNDYNGTIVINTGGGKSKISIDIIKEKGYKNILITSPRTNLKENWKKELNKWGFANTSNPELFCENNKKPIYITLENIQTCYKWTYEQLKQFDLIVCDEIHLITTEKYGALIKKARNINIPIIGLTATPDNDKEEKNIFYKTHCPIIYEYLDSAEDGLINKKQYYVFQYDLTDDFEITTGTKKKQWKIGEAKQYEYLSKQIKKGQQLMIGTGSEDWFADAANWFWKGQGDTNQKKAAMIYLNAIKYRKQFLYNLESSAYYANFIKEKILNKTNKILLFSESINQAKKLSKYSIHSKQDAEINKLLLKNFDEKKINELSSVNSLTLGLNIKEANYAIIESYNSSNVNFKQKAGRLDRLAVYELATIIFIVPLKTQAEQWFNNIIKKSLSNEDIQYFTNINQLLNKI